GDADPLDICVITERSIPHGNIILDAKPLGGIRMIDGGEADDKIIAVLEGDSLYGHIESIDDLYGNIIERLTHYFLTYKEIPNTEAKKKIEITDIYGKEEAYEVIRRTQRDYKEKFGNDKHELFHIIEEKLR